MNDPEDNEQPPETDDQSPPATDDTQEDTSDGKAPPSDPPIIIQDEGNP